MNSIKFKNDLVEVIRPTYLLGFTNAIDLAAKSLSKEDAEQLRMNDSYNPDEKKLANIMAQRLRDRADLQKEKRKFNEWVEAEGDDDDAKGQASNGNGATEA